MFPAPTGLDDRSIAAMPFLNTPEYVDLDVLKALDDVQDLIGNQEEAISIDAFTGGITDESAPYLHMIALEAVHAEAASIVKTSLQRDGRLAPEEEFAVRRLREAAMYDEDVLEAVLAKEWARDGLDMDEVGVLDELRHLNDIDDALELLDMPFLKKVGAFDAPAIRSLVLFKQSNQNLRIDGVGLYDYVVGHEALDGGITDDNEIILSGMAESGVEHPV